MIKKKTKGKSNSKSKQKIKTVKRTVNFKQRRIEQKHSVETIQEALNYIGKGYTIRQAADKYGIAKSTLHAKLTNRYPIQCKKGPSTVLTPDEENDIVEWIIYSASRGFPITKRTLEDNVQKYLNSQKRKTIFKNNRPGPGWYSAFLKRHQQLSNRIAQNLTTSRASVTESNLKEWFSTVKKHLIDKSLLNVDQSRVFNLDESAFMLVPKEKAVLAEKGSRSVYRIVSSNEKACLTVLFNVSASGVMVPPMILFNLQNTPKKPVLEKIPKGWSIGNSERGWMTSDTFYKYITNVFFKWLQENNYEFPIVLYVDGHSSHLTLPLMKFCKREKIELIALFPNATHILQPLDVAVFHPVKEKYREVLRQWRIDNNVIDVKKPMFAPVLKLTLDSIDLTNIIKNGFRTCGLYPFDENAINYNILQKGKKRKNNSSTQENDCTSPSNNVNHSNQILSIFENEILSSDDLELFRAHESDDFWTGDIKFEKLFIYWKKLKRQNGI